MLVSNKFEISYIIKQRLNENKNRFQIDAELIARGYSPETVDKVWYSLAHPTNHKVKWSEKYANRKNLAILSIFGFLTAITLLISDPFPIEPFPQFPSSKQIKMSKENFTTSFGKSFSSNDFYYAYIDKPTTHLQILQTTSSLTDICKFYNRSASKALLIIDYSCDDKYSSGFSFLYQRSYDDFFSAQWGIDVEVFSENDQNKKWLVDELVKNPTPATKIILVINGYFQYNDYD